MATPMRADDPRRETISPPSGGAQRGAQRDAQRDAFCVLLSIPQGFVKLVDGHYPRVTEAVQWLEEQDLPGEFTVAMKTLPSPRWFCQIPNTGGTPNSSFVVRISEVKFCFTDVETALAFKMVWG